MCVRNKETMRERNMMKARIQNGERNEKNGAIRENDEDWGRLTIDWFVRPYL